MNGLHKRSVVGNSLNQDFRQLDMAIIVKEAPGVVGLAVCNVVVLSLPAQMRVLNEIGFMRDGMAFRLLDVECLRSTRREAAKEYFAKGRHS